MPLVFSRTMDASTRWETAAIRSGSRGGSGPPLPTARRTNSTINWATLKEAEAATGVPVNTLRKWVRKGDLPSYLESDGDIALRMVDLDAVLSRARALGRHIQPVTEAATERTIDDQPAEPVTTLEAETGDSSPGTMIVPIDAFNKMLSQLGNLHQAGQQLAEARERAAKAETEATFLRERLAELRSEQPAHHEPAMSEDKPPTSEKGPTTDEVDSSEDDDQPDSGTTTYWRYLTTGWADRRKSRRTSD